MEGHAYLDLTQPNYFLGIHWYHVDGKGEVDLDLQAVIVDRHGMVVDAVYYNNLEALDGAIGAGGDSKGDEKNHLVAGMEEFIWISVSKLPKDGPLP